MSWDRISKYLIESAPILIAIAFLFVFVHTINSVVLGHIELSMTEDYLRAVRETVEPDPSWVSHSLVRVPLSQPLTVVAWMKQDAVPAYQNGETPTNKDTWVAVAFKLKSFCQEYARSFAASPDELTLRLEQRLGLPPGSGYDRLVELTVDPKDFYDKKDIDKKLFRPCADPSLDTDTCELAYNLPDAEALKPNKLVHPPRTTVDVNNALKADGSTHAHQYWFLGKYYTSFASIPRFQYPWTSLGYTFDWAPSEEGSQEFVRLGESEFVLPSGTKVKFVSSTPTAEYCSAK